jgi:hypothetical protein
MAQGDRQGTGRHPHKSTDGPSPNIKEDRGEGDRSRSSHSLQQGQSSRSEHRGSSDTDLKQREYRDEKGEVHHHTRTYMEQHRGEGSKK